MKISVNNIVVSENRARNINQKNVEFLMKSINTFGQIVPIFVNAYMELIAGLHRLEAVKALGMDEIECIVTDETNADKLKAMEIQENITRTNKFAIIEVCKMIWETRASLENLGLYKKVGGKQVEGSYSLDDLADQMGMSRTSIKDYLRVWDSLTEAARAYCMERNFSLKDLKTISKADPDSQIQTAQDIEAGKDTKQAEQKQARQEAKETKQTEDAEKEALKAIIEQLKKERDEARQEANFWKAKASIQGAKENSDNYAPSGTINKKKMVKLLHPDQFQAALAGHPELLEKISDAMKVINSL